MPGLENHTLRLQRERRDNIKALDKKLDIKVDAFDKKIDRNHEEVKERIDRLRQAMAGESIVGRYATAEFERRLSAIEQGISEFKEGR